MFLVYSLCLASSLAQGFEIFAIASESRGHSGELVTISKLISDAIGVVDIYKSQLVLICAKYPVVKLLLFMVGHLYN